MAHQKQRILFSHLQWFPLLSKKGGDKNEENQTNSKDHPEKKNDHPKKDQKVTLRSFGSGGVPSPV